MKYEIYYEYPNRDGDACFQKRFDTFEEAKNSYNDERAGFIQNSEGRVLKRYSGNSWGGKRENSGRPSLYPNKKRYQVMLTEDIMAKVEVYAAREQVSKSDAINYIIDEFFTSK